MSAEMLRVWDRQGRVTETALPAEPEREITPLAFMARLPPGRQAAIAAAALEAPAVLLLLLRLAGAQVVNLDDPETQAGVAQLRAAGLLTAQEAEALLE